jgi:manganese transport protein
LMVVANDRDYMGKWVNGRVNNVISTVFLIILVATSIATLPLLFYTKSGQ